MLKVHIIQNLLSENTGIELEIKKESMYQKGMYQKGKYSVSTIPWHKKKKKVWQNSPVGGGGVGQKLDIYRNKRNKNRVYKNCWAIAKRVLRRKFEYFIV